MGEQPGNFGLDGTGQASPHVGSPQIPAVFHVHGISKVYRMGEVEVHALRGVELDLYAGELVVLLGASGSGKSTLLNILGGLDVPTSGELYYLDHKLTGASEEQLTRFRREHVGFVFQFYNLIPSLTALENVSLVTEIAEHPLEPSEALQLVELRERMHHFPAQMSGGEQQRVAIARAVAKRPDVLLCDEPTGSLDYATGKIVLETYKRSSLFPLRERLALELAERMTYTGKRVTDRFFNRLKRHFSDEELVELAAVIALENFRSKFNPVFGVEPNGFCPLPGVQGAAAAAIQRFH